MACLSDRPGSRPLAWFSPATLDQVALRLWEAAALPIDPAEAEALHALAAVALAEGDRQRDLLARLDPDAGTPTSPPSMAVFSAEASPQDPALPENSPGPPGGPPPATAGPLRHCDPAARDRVGRRLTAAAHTYALTEPARVAAAIAALGELALEYRSVRCEERTR